MTDVPYEPPPPPPPPPPAYVPPPVSAQPEAFDFGRPFAFTFQDPDWIRKVLIGGLVYLAGIFIVGWFFLFGYLAALARNVVAEKQHPLPDWDDLGEYFGEGLRLFGVMLVWIIPVIVLALAFFLPGMILSSVDSEGANAIGSAMVGCISCLFIPIWLAVVFFMPASLLYAAVERRFSAAFEWSRIWPFIKANIGNYLMAIVIYLIARFLAGMGVFLFCIGVVFTGFLAFVVTTYAFADVYRLAKVK